VAAAQGAGGAGGAGGEVAAQAVLRPAGDMRSEGVSLLVEALTARGSIALRDPTAVAQAMARAGAPASSASSDGSGGSGGSGGSDGSGGSGGSRLSGPEAAAADHHEAVALCERPECNVRPEAEGCQVRAEAEAMARANLARALCAQAVAVVV
jgi:hypothetical protein